MLMFNRKTWSFESLNHIDGSAFKRDLIAALISIKDRVLSQASEMTKMKSNPVTKTIARLFRKEKDRNALLKPLQTVIKTYTNITIKNFSLDLDKDLNAYFGYTDLMILIHIGKPMVGLLMQWLNFSKAHSFSSALNLVAYGQRAANDMDRLSGKLRHSMDLSATMGLNSGFLDSIVSEDPKDLEIIASVILHELGHCVDSLDQSLRFTGAAELAEDIVSYVDHVPTEDEANKMLEAVEEGITSCDMPADLRKKYLNAVKKLSKETEHNTDWLNVTTALYTMAVREIESRIAPVPFIGKSGITDSGWSDNNSRGAERRADKYSARIGGGDGIILFCETMMDAVALSKTLKISEFQARWQIKEWWKMLRSNSADYDTFAIRALSVLKEKYQAVAGLAKHSDDKALKDYLDNLVYLEGIVKGMLKQEKGYEESRAFLDSIVKYGGRALFFFVPRSRVDQNSLLSNTIRQLTKNSLHSEAERIRLGIDR